MTTPSHPAGPRGLLIPIAISLAAGAILAISITRWMGGNAVVSQPVQVSEPAPGVDGAANVNRRPGPTSSARPRDGKSEAAMRDRMGEAARRATAQHQAFQAQFASERVDTAWAAEKEAEMLEASVSDQIRTANAMPTNLDFQCRQYICKVGSDFASASVAEDWVILFATAMGGRMPNLSYKYSRNPDGTTHVEAYALGSR